MSLFLTLAFLFLSDPYPAGSWNCSIEDLFPERILSANGSIPGFVPAPIFLSMEPVYAFSI